MRRKTTRCSTALLLGLACSGFGCGDSALFKPGKLDVSETRPELPQATPGTEPYTGDNDIVKSAQSRIFDGFALHANVVYPTCGPINGVCHNAKEYPDLHTPANFLGAVDAPCNVQPGSYEAVFDRCERTGDRLDLGRDRPALEVAYLEYVPGDETDSGDGESAPDESTPGLHLYLAGQLNEDDPEFWTDARFMRTFVNDDGEVEDLPFFTYGSRFRVVSDAPYEFNDGQRGTHLVARVRDYQTRAIEELLAVGVRQADMNRNGILGAQMSGDSVRMIVPGDPESSYLVARLLGTMGDERIPGSRMPLANEPLDAIEMLALFCFIEGLADISGPPDLSAPIDYANCSYSQRPEELELLGSGVSWDGRIARILEFNCGGCHGGDDPAADLNLKDGDVHARLLEASSQRPELKLVEPGQPAMSYLLHKLEGDESIVGAPMPIDPLNGDRMLMPQELADMRAWIAEGALPGSMEPEMDPPDTNSAADAGMAEATDDAGVPDAGP